MCCRYTTTPECRPGVCVSIVSGPCDCSLVSVVALRVELSATRLSAGFGQPALDYHPFTQWVGRCSNPGHRRTAVVALVFSQVLHHLSYRPKRKKPDVFGTPGFGYSSEGTAWRHNAQWIGRERIRRLIGECTRPSSRFVTQAYGSHGSLSVEPAAARQGLPTSILSYRCRWGSNGSRKIVRIRQAAL